jgi:hypothetical protein
MQIKQVAMWRTDDGAVHTTKEMAEQHILNHELVTFVQGCGYPDSAQEIVNSISGNRKLVHDWLDACNAMERASLNG